MIKSFKHKGLKKFFYKGDTSGLNPNHIEKLKFILRRLNSACIIQDMDVSGYRLHPYKNVPDLWSVDVSSNYRILFEFRDCDAYVVDYLDPH
ncbi:MAG: type II toxin-antitoxin system RelE/ParE family toxin [Cyanobacteriota bacterium]